MTPRPFPNGAFRLRGLLIGLVLVPACCCLAFSSSESAQAEPAASIRVEEVTPSRILPHAFFDQALASIPEMYPDGAILASARFERFKGIDYAYVAYRLDSRAGWVRMTMVATDHNRAWRLTSDPPADAIDEQLELYLDHLARLSFPGETVDACTSHPYPEPSAPLPVEPPAAGIYERLSVFDLDLNLGLGHLRPEDTALYVWNWYRKVTFPYFSEPGGREAGWIANGWRLDSGEKKSPLGTSGMLETGYETPSFLVLQARPDGWLQIRLAAPGSENALVWVHSCHLRRAPVKLAFERWEETFEHRGSPLFYRREVAHNLRSAPGIEAKIVHVIPAEGHRYQIELLDTQGDWMQVKVVEPPSYCGGDDQPHQVYQGWIKWRDDRIGPWLYYPTRGC